MAANPFDSITSFQAAQDAAGVGDPGTFKFIPPSTQEDADTTSPAFQTGAATYLYNESKTYNVVSDYRWTLNNKFNKNVNNSFDEVPRVNLIEWEVDQSTILSQIKYYVSAVEGAVTGNSDPLSPYENLFIKNKRGNTYIMPYFSETNFEVNTPMWASLDTLEQGAKAASSLAGVIFGSKVGAAVGQAIEGVAAGAGAVLAANYPKVGIMDRPKLWQSHDYRSINIKFPLFNTVDANDWVKNRSLCWSLVNSNLFSKTSFVTGIPPVFYEILVPGQHFSYAACVTNLVIYNRGNMRQLKDPSGGKCVVPDAYEVNMTLTDMVMPSRNLFQAMKDTKVAVSQV